MDELELFDRFYMFLENEVKLNDNQKIKPIKPKIEKSNKNTAFVNFRNCCESIRRTQIDIQNYINKELCITSSNDSQGVLIINNKFSPKEIIQIFTQYINTYVKCYQCKSLNTILIKKTRITYIYCELCKSNNPINRLH